MSRKHRMAETEMADQLKRAREAQPVTTIKVTASAWREAVRLADGDVTRIEIKSETTVVVRNPRGDRA